MNRLEKLFVSLALAIAAICWLYPQFASVVFWWQNPELTQMHVFIWMLGEHWDLLMSGAGAFAAAMAAMQWLECEKKGGK
jgi:hypothetical protein